MTWDANTAEIVKKSNARMELLRKVSSFGVQEEDLKIFISLQKYALRIILKDKYQNYTHALRKLGIETFYSKRE